MEIQPIILAGGKGTRMESDLPKVLINLKGKPLIEYLINTVEKTIDKKPIVVVGYKKDMVMKRLGDRCAYAVQKEQLGTGHAVGCALDAVRAESVLILYGDMPLIAKEDIDIILNKNKSHKVNIVMGTVTVDDFEDERKNMEKYGRILRDKKGKIESIVEYKDADRQTKSIKELNPSYFLINTKWLKENINLIESNNSQKEYYLTDIVKIAIDKGEDIKTVDINYKSALGANTREELDILEQVLVKYEKGSK